MVPDFRRDNNKFMMNDICNQYAEGDTLADIARRSVPLCLILLSL